MNIRLIHTGKRFNSEWIFRGLDYHFEQGKSYAITGANGSGKSTLLQVLSGALMHSEGSIDFTDDNSKKFDVSNAYKNISIAAPYLELIEEMTAVEFLQFHAAFKKLVKPIDDILQEVNLQNASYKQIRYYSSGMKQRLKLAQAFFSDTTTLLLDEPTTNLDEAGIHLYKSLISKYTTNRLVIVCSNDRNEYEFCEEVIKIDKAPSIRQRGS
jgi:ABC-type multidrug transport system ATPase subunit